LFRKPPLFFPFFLLQLIVLQRQRRCRATILLFFFSFVSGPSFSLPPLPSPPQHSESSSQIRSALLFFSPLDGRAISLCFFFSSPDDGRSSAPSDERQPSLFFFFFFSPCEAGSHLDRILAPVGGLSFFFFLGRSWLSSLG